MSSIKCKSKLKIFTKGFLGFEENDLQFRREVLRKDIALP